MKKAKKIMALMLCAVLLVGATVAGTLAYLKQQTETVKNTFTVGKVSLGEDEDGDGLIDNGLDEAKVNEYGEKLNDEGNVAKEGDTLANRVIENTYKLIPGHTYVKDPMIHVAEGSEPCYLFVEVVNNISTIEEAGDTTIAKQMEKNHWHLVTGEENVYYYDTDTETKGKTTVDAREGKKDIVIFEEFKLKDDADLSAYEVNEESGVVDDLEINVTAYAVQADGFSDANAAWNNTFGK